MQEETAIGHVLSEPLHDENQIRESSEPRKADFSRSDCGAVMNLDFTVWVGLIALVLAILAGIAYLARGGATTYNATSGVFAIQSGVSQVTTLGNYGSGDLTSALISAQAVPSSMIIPGNTTTLQGPTGTSYYTVTGNVSTYTINLVNTTQADCLRELQQTTSGSSWTAVSVNGATATQPVTIVAAQSLCTSGTDTIAWTAGGN
jgi:hypothetical protein